MNYTGTGKQPVSPFIKLGILLLIVVTGIALTVTIINSQRGKLTTDIEPYDSVVKLDGKPIAANKQIYVTPGAHTLTVERDDFTEQKQDLNVVRGRTTNTEVYLSPKNLDGLNWIKNHPDAQLRYQSYVGRSYENEAKNNNEVEPFVKELPFIAGGFEFRIDYGSPEAGSDKPVIYVQADTETAKQDALSWIRSKGYDPAKLNIKYTTSASVNDQEREGSIGDN